MSEWLTTGEMIDRLKVGEVAEDSLQFMTASWDGGKLKFKTIKGNEYDYITINDRNSKWRILPKYVTFSEAMKAIEEGKNVVCYFRDEKIKIESSNGRVSSITYKNGVCESGGGASIPFAWINAGKWTIEE
jgi:hypothetical protein